MHDRDRLGGTAGLALRATAGDWAVLPNWCCARLRKDWASPLVGTMHGYEGLGAVPDWVPSRVGTAGLAPCMIAEGLGVAGLAPKDWVSRGWHRVRLQGGLGATE